MTESSRRTPVPALLLAPVLLAALWLGTRLVLPVVSSAWHAHRLHDDDERVRRAAVEGVLRGAAPDERIAEVFELARRDPSEIVRRQALESLGMAGSRRSLPSEVTDHFARLAAREGPLRVAAVRAVGLSSRLHRYDDALLIEMARSAGDDARPAVQASIIEALRAYVHGQPLPARVYEILAGSFLRDGFRERAALAELLYQASQRQALPPAALQGVVAALQGETQRQTRWQLISILVESWDVYPQGEAALAALAERDDLPEVARSDIDRARALMERKRVYAGRSDIQVAFDRAMPVERRLQAIETMTQGGEAARLREPLATLASDPDPQVAAAAVGLLARTRQTPDREFDRDVLIPTLAAAARHADPQVRTAGQEAIAGLFASSGPYRDLGGEIFEAEIRAGMRDPDGRVRTVATATYLRTDPGNAERYRTIESAIADPDPWVRAHAAGWIGTSELWFFQRERLFDRVAADPEDRVRRAGEQARLAWRRNPGRSWVVRSGYAVLDGRGREVAKSALAWITMAVPSTFCAVFSVYFSARLIAYAMERRRRAWAAAGALAVWIGASFGLAMTFFAAGVAHTGRDESIAAILWLGIAGYVALAFLMRAPLRR